MSFDFEVAPVLDSVTGMQEESFIAEYHKLYEEEDLTALGINPSEPTGSKPGSDDKVLMLAARYAAGLPLWHEQDRNDHGPDEVQLEEV